MTHRRVTAAGVAGLGGTLLVVAAHVGVLVATGSRPASVLLWLVVVVVGVLAPGVALVRACRPRTVALVEDLSWGAAAGLLVALAGWLADRLLRWPPGPLVWGLLVVAVS